MTVGEEFVEFATAPNGRTVYADSDKTNMVTPITTATNTAGRPIKVGTEPYSIVFVP